MRLITLNRAKPNSSVEFYGCPMNCKYCSHTAATFKDHPLNSVILALSDNGIRSVFVGGAEPAMHQKEALDLVHALHSRGKEVLLKTTGYDPKFVEATKGWVSRYVLEVKTPLDDALGFTQLTAYDVERAKKHLENVNSTLNILRGEKVRATLRVLPDRYDTDKVERIAKDLKGYVDELLMTQFLSNSNDVSFAGIFSPGPAPETMRELAVAARKHLPKVRFRGNGFDETI